VQRRCGVACPNNRLRRPPFLLDTCTCTGHPTHGAPARPRTRSPLPLPFLTRTAPDTAPDSMGRVRTRPPHSTHARGCCDQYSDVANVIIPHGFRALGALIRARPRIAGILILQHPLSTAWLTHTQTHTDTLTGKVWWRRWSCRRRWGRRCR
jgi:hypothetical protein